MSHTQDGWKPKMSSKFGQLLQYLQPIFTSFLFAANNKRPGIQELGIVDVQQSYC